MNYEARVIRQEYKNLSASYNTLKQAMPKGQEPKKMDQKRILEDSWQTFPNKLILLLKEDGQRWARK